MSQTTDQGTIKVLLIDDDEDDYIIARDLLLDSGNERFDIQWAPTYEAGLQAFSQRQADVCLLDFRLGAHNGLELLSEAKSAGCNIPVIMLTGQGAYSTDTMAMKAGAVDYLEKSQITPSLLERSIRYALARQKAETELRRQSRELAQTVTRLDQLAAQLERNNEHLLSILDHLRLAAVLVDHQGRVTFISQACIDLLHTDHGMLGRPWEEVFPFSNTDVDRLKAAMREGAQQPEKISVQFSDRAARQYWAEVEIRPDPRDPRCRMFFVYDQTPIQDLRRLLSRETVFRGMVGKSDAMQVVFDQVRELAKLDSTVLIEGQTGTGKEMVARAIHEIGHRKDQPFVALNCAGLTESLLASQLFGHRRGAFTGAVADQEGVFETASGGTLLLDEIGDISPSVQVSLLRVLQEKEIIPIGETKPRKVDVRIIAATQHDLGVEVRAGRFRPDLLYRIRVARVWLPPLKERRMDIPLMVESFLQDFRASMGKSVSAVDENAIRALLDHDWPGNVRELQSAIEFASIRCRGSTIGIQDLPAEIQTTEWTGRCELEGIRDEKQRVLAALMQVQGNRSAAAKLLNIGRTTLYRRLKCLGIE